MNAKLVKIIEELNIDSELRKRFEALYENQNRKHEIKQKHKETVIEDSKSDVREKTFFEKTDAGNKGDVLGFSNLGRYVDRGKLGRGGMAEVRRVKDIDLNRNLAMKIIDHRLLTHKTALARFVHEAQTLSQLQHPNIVPIHEMGRLEDGRYYFTMKEIKGLPLSDIITQVHHVSTEKEWKTTDSGWSLRRLIEVFSKICSAVAFAHKRGVIHRDLKPDNIMVGKFDQVLVVDWGIAKVLCSNTNIGNEENVVITDSDAFQTQMGSIAGTPAYMAPEQARGQIDKINSRTDIYSLGAILYEILSGRSPFLGSSQQVLSQVLVGPPLSVRETAADTPTHAETIGFDLFQEDSEENIEIRETKRQERRPIPEPLVIACEKAMQRLQENRFQNAETLQLHIENWLNGIKKREQALSIIEQAVALEQQRKQLISEANQEEQRAAQQAEEMPSWTPEKEMAPLWKIEDHSQNLRMEARRHRVHIEQLLQSALTHKRDLPEAHEQLVLFYIDSHKEAERNENQIKMRDAYSRIQFHAKELHESNPIRTNAEHYVQGMGSVSLRTNEPGADVFIASYIEKNRRLVLGDERFLGKTPLEKIPLEMGSHQLRICKENRKEVVYPIQITRQHHWSGLDPFGIQQSIYLPKLDELGPEDCYVPAGYFLCGKDPNIQVQLPPGTIWVDGFVVRKHPVTNREILAQLNDLSLRGHSEQLEEAIPRPRSASGEYGHTCFEKQPDGRFLLIEDEHGIVPDPDFPVVMISWHQAVAYTQWPSEKTGQKWRLLDELEWEKSSKGVDGRLFPWGNHFHPNWCCMDTSKPQKSIEKIFDRPSDVSVYGVEGLAGNVFDWTLTPFSPLQGLPKDNYCRPKIPKTNPGQAMTFRGGSWHSIQMFSHLSFRWGWEDFQTWPMHGFRIGRSLS